MKRVALRLIGIVCLLPVLARAMIAALDWIGRAETVVHLFQLGEIGNPISALASIPASMAWLLLLIAFASFYLLRRTSQERSGGAGGDASAYHGGEAFGGVGGDAGSHGPGGKGGTALAVGKRSKAVGGRGGRGGVAAGGDGGDATMSGEGICIGGAGGEAGQLDGRGGRGGQTIEPQGPYDQLLANGRWLSEYGRGGNGANSAEYDRRLAIVASLRREYFDHYRGSPPHVLPDRKCLDWLNGQLASRGERWRVRVTAEAYEFFSA